MVVSAFDTGLAKGSSLDCAGRILDLTDAVVMGILNVTPDSFSDGGQLYVNDSLRVERAVARAYDMVEQGAAIIDIGGESTRPGASPVSLAEERARVLPVLRALGKDFPAIISLDSSSPELMLEAADLGVGLINDVRALGRPGAVSAVASRGVAVCLMHMQGQPSYMQDNPTYNDVIVNVLEFLKCRLEVCLEAGISPGCVVLDPGFGFGKTIKDNLALMANFNTLGDMGFPLLVGVSRKSMIGAVLNKEPDQRMAGGLALAALAVNSGAKIIRTHDVAETADVVNITNAVVKEKRDE
jgi:dihydropteroate synthase